MYLYIDMYVCTQYVYTPGNTRRKAILKTNAEDSVSVADGFRDAIQRPIQHPGNAEPQTLNPKSHVPAMLGENMHENHCSTSQTACPRLHCRVEGLGRHKCIRIATKES